MVLILEKRQHLFGCWGLALAIGCTRCTITRFRASVDQACRGRVGALSSTPPSCTDRRSCVNSSRSSKFGVCRSHFRGLKKTGRSRSALRVKGSRTSKCSRHVCRSNGMHCAPRCIKQRSSRSGRVVSIHPCTAAQVGWPLTSDHNDHPLRLSRHSQSHRAQLVRRQVAPLPSARRTRRSATSRLDASRRA